MERLYTEANSTLAKIEALAFVTKQGTDIKETMNKFILFVIALPTVSCLPSHEFKPSGPSDLRSACPEITSDFWTLKNPSDFDLHTLSEHNFIDVSLTRTDIAFGDNLVLNETLLTQMIETSADAAVLTWKDMVEHNKRDIVAAQIAFFQLTFGSWSGGVPLDVVQSIFGREKMPESYTHRIIPITLPEFLIFKKGSCVLETLRNQLIVLKKPHLALSSPMLR
ncbi:hypothetical protein PROFUN_10091 [Planoprotostelium fungivorum]|uniref:Heme haloperoxidase family profile domain-containing protein n=1 Tax=Planoprotostelium fungivorum TaxID=1890364 RepID=A0A2P6NF09_9EUKA|nr:hypothetical protein PROFUN_10091 [Planoprotostelium fungivorum]